MSGTQVPIGCGVGPGETRGDTYCDTDAANPAWGWDDSDDTPGRGALATDPGTLAFDYFNWPGKPSTPDNRYLFNVFKDIRG